LGLVSPRTRPAFSSEVRPHLSQADDETGQGSPTWNVSCNCPMACG
jgi:hypothetical protein